MIPNTKISHTILLFGKELILGLPENHTKEEFESTIQIVITVWNAVVMDTWSDQNCFENKLVTSLDNLPKEMKIIIRRLIKRKKKKFAADQRAVGNHWIREENGEFIFGCEARINIQNVPTVGMTH